MSESQLLNTQQKRTEALYDRELRIAVYKITKEEQLPFLPINYCRIDKKFQSLKIYSPLEENEKGALLLADFNKKYAPAIQHLLASTKKFRRIPHLVFLFDHEFNELNKLEEIAEKI